jgi:hypothetical protein
MKQENHKEDDVFGYPARLQIEERNHYLTTATCLFRRSSDVPGVTKKMEKVMKLTKTLRMLGIIAALLGCAATQSFALPANEIETVYFSDATYAKEVGYVFRACQGGMYREGKTSRYRVHSSTPCNGSHPLNEIACYAGSVLTTCPANICNSGLFDCQ